MGLRRVSCMWHVNIVTKIKLWTTLIWLNENFHRCPKTVCACIWEQTFPCWLSPPAAPPMIPPPLLLPYFRWTSSSPNIPNWGVLISYTVCLETSLLKLCLMAKHWWPVHCPTLWKSHPLQTSRVTDCTHPLQWGFQYFHVHPELYHVGSVLMLN